MSSELILSFMKIKTKILLAVVGGIVLASCITGFTAHQMMREFLFAQVEARLGEAAKKVEERVERFLQDKEREVQLLSKNPKLKLFMFDSTKVEVNEIVSMLKFVAHNFHDIIILDKDGKEIIKIIDRKISSHLTSQEKQEFFREARKAGLYVNPLFIHEVHLGVPDRLYAQKIFNIYEEFAGVLVAHVSYQRLGEIIGDVSFGEEGAGYLLNGEGYLVSGLQGGRPERYLKKDEKPNESFYNIVQRQRRQGEGFLRTMFKGVDSLVSYRLIPSQKWVVVMTLPYDVFARGLQKLKGLLFGVSLMVIVFGSFVGVFIATRVARPLQLLADSSEAIADGDFSKKVLVTTKDEVGMLALAFERMRLNLQEVVESLKHHIAELDEARRVVDSNYHRQIFLNRLVESSLREDSLDEILQQLIDQLMISPWITLEPRGAVFVVDPISRTLVMKVQKGLGLELQEGCSHIPFGKCLCGKAAQTKETVFSSHVDDKHEIQYVDMKEHVHCCVPIVSAQKDVLGVINLYLEEGAQFDQGQIDFLKTVANVLASIIERKRAQESLSAANAELAASEKALQNMFDDLNKAHQILKETQGKLVQSEKMASIGQLAAGIAHEINNPAGFIGSNLQVLEQYWQNYLRFLLIVEDLQLTVMEKDFQKAQQAAEHLALLKEELRLDFMQDDINNLLHESQEGVDRIKKIVMDLRTFAREGHEASENIKIEEIVESVLGIVFNELKYKADLKKEYGQTAEVSCNAQKLGQVFVNLLVNAAQAIEERGEIMVKTYQKRDEVYVEVADTGKGIPKEKISRIFDPFYTTKPVGEGTGLGLSISYDIVKKHGGDITVDSGEGRGTTFTVMLPKSDKAKREEKKKTA